MFCLFSFVKVTFEKNVFERYLISYRAVLLRNTDFKIKIINIQNVLNCRFQFVTCVTKSPILMILNLQSV